jgi:type IV secretory pathway VirB10-like protein
MSEPNRDPQLTNAPIEPAGSQVQDRAVRPPGVLPKNTQTYIIIGIAVLMVGAIAFSGAGTPPRNAATATAKTPTAVDPNWARIQDYRNRIDEQARKLTDEQAKLEQAKQAFGIAPGAAPPATQMTPPPGYAYPAYQQPEPRPEPKPEKSAIEVDKEKREYQSLFASNVALSYRKSEDQPAIATAAPPSTAPIGSISYPPPTQAAVRTTKAPAATETDSEEVEPVVPDTSTRSTASNRKKVLPSINEAGGKQYRLFEGSIIETALTNRLNGSFTGPVNCLVTTDVYSHDRQHVLIPRGSRVLGEAKRNDSFGQQRIAVFFHRLIMPDGFSVDLDQFHGLNQIGETGLRDQVNHHYGQVFGISLAVGAIAGLATINTGSALNASGVDAYRQGVATNLSQSSLSILDKYLNVLPTFTIREGHRIKVILSDDLELPAYERHKMPSDL